MDPIWSSEQEREFGELVKELYVADDAFTRTPHAGEWDSCPDCDAVNRRYRAEDAIMAFIRARRQS